MLSKREEEKNNRSFFIVVRSRAGGNRGKPPFLAWPQDFPYSARSGNPVAEKGEKWKRGFFLPRAVEICRGTGEFSVEKGRFCARPGGKAKMGSPPPEVDM